MRHDSALTLEDLDAVWNIAVLGLESSYRKARAEREVIRSTYPDHECQ